MAKRKHEQKAWKPEDMAICTVIEREEQISVAGDSEPIIEVVESETVEVKPLTPKPVRARSRTFVAKPCTVCEALREKDTNFTRVFATRGNIRYCRCHYCGNTWKDWER
jgi:hypothetical protein